MLIIFIGDIMFYKYEIKNNELYLYLTMNYEFSNEFSYNSDSNLNKITLDFINSNNIIFDGNVINYVVDNIVVKKINLLRNNSIVSTNNLYSCVNFTINLKLDDNSLCEISLHDYLLSTLFEKYNKNFNTEVLKCICVLFNTYAYRCMEIDKCLIANNYFSFFKPLKYYEEIFPNYKELIKYFDNIIMSVDCIFMSYNNQYILPFIHYSNSGKTSNNTKYPYLSSVSSLWDILSSNYLSISEFSFERFSKLLNCTCDNKTSFSFINQNNSRKLKINNKIFTLEEIKNLLNLRSSEFNFIIYKDKIIVILMGIGNGLGLSLYGSNELAKNGCNFNNILKYYFPKVKLFKYIKELS